MITYALRVWEVRYTGQVDVKSTVYLHWAEAAWAIASVVIRQLHPIVELVPCVDVCGLDDDHERWCPTGKQKARAREDSETRTRTLPPLMGSTAPVAKMRPRKVKRP